MWHTQSVKSVMEKLNTSPQGLSGEEVKNRLLKTGENKFENGVRKSVIGAFLKQMSDSMVLILLASAVISVLTTFLSGEGDYLDAIIILTIVCFNGVMGVVQEFKAEHALEELKKLNSPTAKVIREGKEQTIDTAEIVPGDIILIESGDFVPADARLIEAVKLTADESALTGETGEIKKSVDIIGNEDAPVAELHNMVWAHTVISGGRGKAVVVETGMNTQTGKVAGMIIGSESPETPLQLRLKKTGKVLGITAIIICGIIFFMGILRHQPPLEMFITSVSLAVAAIPEGLPAIVTVMLAIGVQKMAQKNAVVRKLPAVETLGSATVICTDKTGTLTRNEMTVTDVFGDREKLFFCISLCNDKKGATENALYTAATKEGININELWEKYKRVDEIPFSSERKVMTTVHKTDKGYTVVSKGAPDVILPLCSISAEKKKEILNKNIELARSGKRVIAAAYKEITSLDGKYEQNLVFAGLAAMSDPLRDGVEEAVKTCKKAGIKVVMITGDQKDTALAIAKETGICRDETCVMSGKEIDSLTDDKFERMIEKYRVFYRVTPEHKMRIVRAFQRNDEVVAMTGDGVNDAPALKYADIGCAMGKSGTDVAKGAADMVLSDDNFTTITEAVRQGRGIYHNIRKAVRFLLSSNIGEIFTIFTAIFFGRESPLSAIQLLWMNLVTDSLPAVALGLQPADHDIMCKKPIQKNRSIFADGMGIAIFLEGVVIGLISTIAFIIGNNVFGSNELGKTMCFCTLSMSQLFHAFAVASEYSVFSLRTKINKYMMLAFACCMIMQISVVVIPVMRNMFETCALGKTHWIVVLLLSAMPLIISEIEKLRKKS